MLLAGRRYHRCSGMVLDRAEHLSSLLFNIEELCYLYEVFEPTPLRNGLGQPKFLAFKQCSRYAGSSGAIINYLFDGHSQVVPSQVGLLLSPFLSSGNERFVHTYIRVWVGSNIILNSIQVTYSTSTANK